MTDETKRMGAKVFSALNDPEYRDYWFPRLIEVRRTGTVNVFKLVGQDGSESKLRVVAESRTDEERDRSWREETVLVSGLGKFRDLESICEHIQTTFLAYNAFWTRRAEEKERRVIAFIKRETTTQQPSWFEIEFFGISAHHLYNTLGDEELLILTEERVLRDEFQHSFYGWDPKRPPTRLGQRVCQILKNNLPNELKSHLRLYCLLASKSDRHDNTDLIITLNLPNSNRVRVDLTSFRDKENTETVLIFGPHDCQKDNRRLNKFAKRVMRRLLP